MKAMIFAAGEGKRMRPLTDNYPKPLLKVAGKYLIVHQLEKLVALGVKECVVNVSYQAEKIMACLGDGSRYGLRILYSEEASPLETGGGVNRALQLLGQDDFLLVNADLWVDLLALQELLKFTQLHREEASVFALLVSNAPHHPEGDFGITQEGQVLDRLQDAKDLVGHYTFSGVSVISASYFSQYPKRRSVFPLKEFLLWAIQHSEMKGLLYDGPWLDVGTPERLAQCEKLAIG